MQEVIEECEEEAPRPLLHGAGTVVFMTWMVTVAMDTSS